MNLLNIGDNDGNINGNNNKNVQGLKQVNQEMIIDEVQRVKKQMI